MSTISPVPSTVAPVMPVTRCSCGPIDFTTISWLLPTISSTCSAMALVAAAQVQRRREAFLFATASRSREDAGDNGTVAPILPFGLARRIGGDQLLLPQLQHLFDHHGGNRVDLRARAHQHRLGHGKGKRQVDGEAGALPPREAHLHASAKRGDFAAHHVHADAAPGHLRDHGGGGESRLENEIGDLRLGECRTGRNEAFFDRFLADPVDREARAVIGQ